jgi:hypothetical protein
MFNSFNTNKLLAFAVAFFTFGQEPTPYILWSGFSGCCGDEKKNFNAPAKNY